MGRLHLSMWSNQWPATTGGEPGEFLAGNNLHGIDGWEIGEGEKIKG